MIDIIKKAIKGQADKLSLFSNIVGGNDLILKGLPGSMKALLISLISDRLSNPVLSVLPSHEAAEAFAESLSSLQNEEAGFFPGGDEDPESPMILNPHRVGCQRSAGCSFKKSHAKNSGLAIVEFRTSKRWLRFCFGFNNNPLGDKE